MYRIVVATVQTSMHMQTFDISPKKVARLLLSIALGLSVTSFAASLTRHFLGTTIGGMTDRLMVGNDSSLPTWFASFLLFIAALLLGLITFVKKQQKADYVKHWFFLSLLFLYISIDEVATFRETFSRNFIRPLISVGGVFHYKWVIVGIPFVIIVALLYLRFFSHLPKQVRNLFAKGCGIFVLGAIGMEMTVAAIHSAEGSGMLQVIFTVIEEFLEMAGVILVIYALLLYIRFENIRGIQVRVKAPQKNHSSIAAGSDRY